MFSRRLRRRAACEASAAGVVAVLERHRAARLLACEAEPLNARGHARDDERGDEAILRPRQRPLAPDEVAIAHLALASADPAGGDGHQAGAVDGSVALPGGVDDLAALARLADRRDGGMQSDPTEELAAEQARQAEVAERAAQAADGLRGWLQHSGHGLGVTGSPPAQTHAAAARGRASERLLARPQRRLGRLARRRPARIVGRQLAVDLDEACRGAGGRLGERHRRLGVGPQRGRAPARHLRRELGDLAGGVGDRQRQVGGVDQGLPREPLALGRRRGACGDRRPSASGSRGRP